MKFFKLLSILTVFGFSIMASAQETDSLAVSPEVSNHKAIRKDYLSIVYGPYSFKYNMAYVSLNGEDYQKIKQKRSKLFNHYDFNGLIKLIKNIMLKVGSLLEKNSILKKKVVITYLL